MTTALWQEDDGSVIGFMCLTDWELEIGAAMGGSRIFPSVEDARKNLKCWKGCGIAKVRVSFVEIAEQGTGP